MSIKNYNFSFNQIWDYQHSIRQAFHKNYCDTVLCRAKLMLGFIRMIKMCSWTVSELPKPTNDCERVKYDLDHWGYGLLEGALTDPLLGNVRKRLLDQAAAEKELGHAFEDGGPEQKWGEFRDKNGKLRSEVFTAKNGGINQRVWLLPNKGQEFIDILEIDAMYETVGHVLGEEFQLSSFSSNIAKPGGSKMNLHTDQWWAPEPTRLGRRNLPVGSMTRSIFDFDPDRTEPPIALAPAACSNAIFMMNDFTDINGGTRLVPRSHLMGRHPDPVKDANIKTVAAEGSAGTAIITDGRIWHGTGSNRTDENRVAMLLTFCGPQYRPQVNYTIALDPEVLEQATDRQKTMFGLKVWWGYGRTGHPSVEFINPSDKGLGQLNPS